MRAIDAAERRLRLPFDRLYVRLPDRVDTSITQMCAESAVVHARLRAPKMSGASARRLVPIWGSDYFGIRWLDRHMWYQEMGIRAFTMHNLAGKVIPMWVDDPDGKEKSENPKAETRFTADGRRQTLIFRRAANKGERKKELRTIGGIARYVDVPRSYPGAPGRINRRRKGAPFSRMGGGQIMRGNGGVRWRNPGMASKFFMHEGILLAAREVGLPPGIQVQVAVQGVVL